MMTERCKHGVPIPWDDCPECNGAPTRPSRDEQAVGEVIDRLEKQLGWAVEAKLLRHALRAAKPADEGLKAEVERLARAFVAKLDECQPYIDSAFFQMANHGMPHTGPQYGKELDALRAALASTDDRGEGEQS